MEDHGREQSWQRPTVADSKPRSIEEWVFSSVDEATKEAARRHSDFVADHPQTPDDLRRVDAKAIGDLYGDATSALHIGRHEGLVGPSTDNRGEKNEALAAAHFDEHIATATDLGLITVYEYGYKGIQAATEEDPAVSDYLDNGLDYESVPTLLCPGVVPVPKPRRARWNEHVPDFMVQDLPDIATVEEVSTPRCKCPHPDRHEQAKAQVEGLKQRPGDQQLPQTNDEPYIQNLVVDDIKDRLQVGISRYGTGLQPFNGRDALRDAYEEALDLTMYLKQVCIENERLNEDLAAALDRAAQAEEQVRLAGSGIASDHVKVLQDTLAEVERVVFAEQHLFARDTINRLTKVLRPDAVV